jgi:competence protein ComEA
VPAGSRVGDAIVAAGGYSSAVDLDAAAAELNLAATVSDGDKLHVPSLAERVAIAQRSPIADAGSAAAPGGLIDLNHADQAALESLPGIGPVTAAKIITARSSQPFASLDDAATRKVLSASVVEQIRPLATVRP